MENLEPPSCALAPSSMPKESLQARLAELQAALKDAEFKDPADRERLNALMANLEAQIEAPEPFAEDETLLGSMEESIGLLEIDHPIATSVLQRILQVARTLGAGGI